MASFVVTVDLAQTTPIDNTATVAANETDPNAGNDSATATTTIDDDGVDAATEDAGPNGGDCNLDGTADRLQPSVTGLPSTDGDYLCVVTTGGSGPPPRPGPTALSGGAAVRVNSPGNVATCVNRNVAVVDIATLPADQTLAVSHLQIRSPLSLEIPCPAATVTVLYFGVSELSQGVYRKYGPTASDPTDHWYTLAATLGTTTIADETVVTATLELTDGGDGDSDLLANGTIVDPGGVALLAAGIPTLSQWAALWLATLLAGAAVLLLRRGSF